MPSIFSEPLCRCCADESRCPVDSDYAIGHLPFSSPPCNVDPAHRNLPYLPVSEPSTSFDHIGSNLMGEKRCGKRNCITRRAASTWRAGSAWMKHKRVDALRCWVFRRLRGLAITPNGSRSRWPPRVISHLHERLMAAGRWSPTPQI